MPGDSKLYPVILSGGAGSRLWPLSRTQCPKQLLSLCGTASLLQDTARRVSDPSSYGPALVIANEAHRFIVAEQLREVGLTTLALVLEPVGRNTAPAAAVAALLLQERDPEAVLALLPSDQLVGAPEAFAAAMMQAQAAARAGFLVTLGITPQRPETGYGYIKRGQPLAQVAGACRVERFVEKPDPEAARSFLEAGDYDWNAGMFVLSAATLLDEMACHCPAILAAAKDAVETAAQDQDFMRLGAEAFAACPSDSIDYAVMERTDRAAVVPADIGWNDVGAWPALWDLADKDEAGNAVLGDAITEDVTNSYLRSEDGRLLAAVGLEDVILVSTADAVLAVARARAGEVKALVEKLKQADRGEAEHHRQVLRPWGDYTDTDAGEGFRVKRIVVKPGGRLSLQRHQHRAEHWVVVQGTARVTLG